MRASTAGFTPATASPTPRRSRARTASTAITMTSGNTYRIKPDGSRIEQWTWGQVNPFGLAFDPYGNLYSGDCHSRPLTMLLRHGWYVELRPAARRPRLRPGDEHLRQRAFDRHVRRRLLRGRPVSRRNITASSSSATSSPTASTPIASNGTARRPKRSLKAFLTSTIRGSAPSTSSSAPTAASTSPTSTTASSATTKFR